MKKNKIKGHALHCRGGNGFTLVELLVVVGIIGILASIGVASLNSARQKARDAKRIADVKQMSTILEAEEGSIPAQNIKNGSDATKCAAAFSRTNECDSPGKEVGENFPKLLDPSAPSGLPCKDDPSKSCAYSIANRDGNGPAKTNDYQVCFYLESGAASLPGGLSRVESGGVFAQGCRIVVE